MNRTLALLILLEASCFFCGVRGFRRPHVVQGRHRNGQVRKATTCTRQPNDVRIQGPRRRRVILKQSDNDELIHARLAAVATSTGTTTSSSNRKFKNFEEMLSAYKEEPLMVIFTAVNCGPCRLMKKEMNQVSIRMPFKMFSVDTEKFPHVGSRFQVAALPCLVLVQNGEPVLRLEGVVKAEEVIERVQTIVTSSSSTV
ncbi:Thioredoxin [Seminavis robusta]|uniref:Thioredoxin n=1 Tax=Seminavis robusta TaxID=568900 RepID=A0A9N8EUV3_9STRA|nr:Thioredoxin [Seminavis robusta]|eukprot:Sro1891_g303800.1 Thioredoxin (199) ;mRNA; f:13243-13839